MLVTEDRAVELWCPFARLPENGVSANRISSTVDGVPNVAQVQYASLCMASECMAWRWQSTDPDDGFPNKNEDGMTLGFCGLAGRPQW